MTDYLRLKAEEYYEANRERIKEYLYKRNGEVLDEKILKKLNKRYKKKINKQNYDFLRTNQDSSINNNTINNIYPLNIDKNRILNKVEDKNFYKYNKFVKFYIRRIKMKKT